MNEGSSYPQLQKSSLAGESSKGAPCRAFLFWGWHCSLEDSPWPKLLSQNLVKCRALASGWQPRADSERKISDVRAIWL